MLSPVVRIVDDDASVCESQSFFLQLAGFRTRSFSSAEDFLRDDDAEAPGCIILDVRMGGMTGIELQQELNRRGSDLPIIFLSAHGDIEMAMSCVEAGAFNFLVKPLNRKNSSLSSLRQLKRTAWSAVKKPMP